MLGMGKNRFIKAKRVPSFFKMANAMWKNPEEPFIFSSLSVDMSNALAWIKSHKKRTGEKITVTHLCTKALAMAYRKYPQVNAKVEANKIYRRKTVDFHILVSTESGDELSGIKLKDADQGRGHGCEKKPGTVVSGIQGSHRVLLHLPHPMDHENC
jgi:hypothetical protein